MKKVIIIGVTGSGKSTLGKKLAQTLDLPYIQLDKLFWKPNWEGSSDQELFAKIESAVQSPSWVIDGNYSRTNHLTWSKADTVIWLDLPLWLTLFQNVSRSITRTWNNVELWENTGNRESFKRMFSRDSIIVWLFKTYYPHKKRNEAQMVSPDYSHIQFYRLKSRSEIQDFLSQI